jgi:oligopeptide/dipeptide ABC transporter ATP-binding protein
MSLLLDVQGLSVGIKKDGKCLTAVNNVSFQARAGEIVGLAGESGCGKTLTARAIPLLLPRNAHIIKGSVKFNGVDMAALSQKELSRIRGNELSMICQEHVSSLNPLTPIWRQIGEALELHSKKGKKFIRARVLETMESVGFANPEKSADLYPHQLSGGMCQRAAIASAIICKHKLLIADEPTTALDSVTQVRILQLLKKINQGLGMSIIFISHDLEALGSICDRILVMYAGKLVEEGSTKAVFSHPRHEYTKGLLASAPVKEQKGKPLANIPGRVPSLNDISLKFGGGCPFAPRCLRAEEACFADFPEKVSIDDQHHVYCKTVKAGKT